MVTLILDKERNLNMDLNVMEEFEELSGKTIFSAINENLSAKTIKLLLYVSFKQDEPGITREYVGKIVKPSKLVGIIKAISDAWTSANEEKPASPF